MLSIGEFSKICEVSTKTLRYYDEIGLIKPSEINPENGYRYYSINQLKDMLFINRLKSYSFSLEEIKSIIELEEDESEESLYKELYKKMWEMEQKISKYKSTINQMKDDILKIEKGESIMSYLNDIEVELVETIPMNILFIRKNMSAEDFSAGFISYYNKLYEKIQDEKLTQCGAPMAFYHTKEYNPYSNDTELAVPIKEYVKGTRDLPGGLCVKSVLKGSYTNLPSVYSTMMKWINDNKYKIINAPYEIYLSDPYKVANEDENVTEIYFPVKKI